jgi:hypothetical protein
MNFFITFCLMTTFVSGQLLSKKVVTGNCTEVFDQPPRRGTSFSSTFDRNVDLSVLGGRIVLYRIRWNSNFHSDWFVPDFNDIDWKYTWNSESQTMRLRRVWSYFESHIHTYVICK